MVSTFLSYDLVARDMAASLKRTASDTQVTREAEYYKENISKVTTVDEFVDDYTLYSYAMKAHGLEDMIYAKAFMKKVLESDLSDENSYANKLTDDRYRNFATAFQFSPQTVDAQSDAQETSVLELYKQAQGVEANEVADETDYYDVEIDKITSATELVGNSRLFQYVLDALGIDRGYYTDDHFVQVLASDPTDTNSYLGQLIAKDDASDYDLNSYAFKELNSYFSFNTDGSLVNATAQTSEQKDEIETLYIDNKSTYVSEYTLDREQAYWESRIATITTVDELTADSRLFDYVKAAFQLDSNLLKSTFSNIVTSDLTDPDNYALKYGGSAWTSIVEMFNFDTDGNVKASMTAQSDVQLATTKTAYANHFDDADVEDLTTLLDGYSTAMSNITSVDDLLDNSTLRVVFFKAFGLEEGEYSDAELKKALTSDLADPKSYANKSRDERLQYLASAFNFDSKGEAEAPLMAQNEITITTIAKDYIVNKSRYLKDTELETAKEAAGKESAYYQEQMTTITNVSQFLADRRLVDFVLVAKGIDPSEVTDEFMSQLFAADIDNPKSFVNQQDDERYSEIVASFNFGTDGNISKDYVGTVQQRGKVLETQHLYLHQTMEEEQGNDNAGVRLALYFERVAPTLTDAYDLLGDEATLEVFRTAFGFSSDFSSMDLDQQKKYVEKNVTLSDFQDPEKLKRFISRFTAMYDLENNSTSDPSLALFNNSYAGISADLLLNIATLKGG